MWSNRYIVCCSWWEILSWILYLINWWLSLWGKQLCHVDVHESLSLHLLQHEFVFLVPSLDSLLPLLLWQPVLFQHSKRRDKLSGTHTAQNVNSLCIHAELHQAHAALLCLSLVIFLVRHWDGAIVYGLITRWKDSGFETKNGPFLQCEGFYSCYSNRVTPMAKWFISKQYRTH